MSKPSSPAKEVSRLPIEMAGDGFPQPQLSAAPVAAQSTTGEDLPAAFFTCLQQYRLRWLTQPNNQPAGR